MFAKSFEILKLKMKLAHYFQFSLKKLAQLIKIIPNKTPSNNKKSLIIILLPTLICGCQSRLNLQFLQIKIPIDKKASTQWPATPHCQQIKKKTLKLQTHDDYQPLIKLF